MEPCRESTGNELDCQAAGQQEASAHRTLVDAVARLASLALVSVLLGVASFGKGLDTHDPADVMAPQWGDVWKVDNSDHDMQVRFHPEGIEVAGASAEDTWSTWLRLVEWGRPGSLQPAPPASRDDCAGVVNYRRGSLTEWYANGEAGLEQGFDIAAPPSGQGPLQLVLSYDEGLTVALSEDRRNAQFIDPTSEMVLHYSGLRAWDSRGTELSAWLSNDDACIAIVVDDEHAVYPLHVDPWLLIQRATLSGNGGVGGDDFGSTTDLSGDFIVVGAPLDDFNGAEEAGSIAVFVRSGSTWIEETTIYASDSAAYSRFGSAVAIDGSTIVVGAPGAGPGSGAAYVFERNGATWTEKQKLVAQFGAANDSFGAAVDVQGDTVLVGAPDVDLSGVQDAGRAYVFVQFSGVWGLESLLTYSAPEDGDSFGSSVAILGDRALIGAPGQWVPPIGWEVGDAYIFERIGSWWSQQAKLSPSGAAGYQFGCSVALGDDRALVGAASEDSAFIYSWDGTDWIQSTLMPSTNVLSDAFGHSVALDGDLALVGAPWAQHALGSNAGSFFVFAYKGNSWEERAGVTTGSSQDALLGSSVAIEGSDLAVGAPGLDLAYVFDVVAPPGIGAPVTWSEASGGNGHSYELVFGTPSWSEARADAESRLHLGEHGYLATITSSAEHGFLQQMFVDGSSDNLWVGASDAASEGDWRWVTGPEAGVPFWEGTSSGFAPAPLYFAPWGGVEPNNSGAGQNHALWAMGPSAGGIGPGDLLDGPESGMGHNVVGYVVEYGAPGASYCTAGTSASGCQATIASTGSPSASASSGFLLMVAQVEGAKDGILFFGKSGRQANPWGNGTSFQCVVPPVRRGGLLSGSGSPLSCDGVLWQDLNAHWCPTCSKPAHNPGAGALVQAQLWYRDPLNTSNQTTSFSDAIEFVVGP